MSVTVESDDYGMPITTLTGAVDQAALQGILRRLYSLGLPLISVNKVAGDRRDLEDSYCNMLLFVMTIFAQ